MEMEAEPILPSFNDSRDNFYLATAHKSSAVTHVAVGELGTPGDVYVVMAKTTRLECFHVEEEHLMLMCDVPVYGRVAALLLISLSGVSSPALFVLTEQLQYSLLFLNVSKKEFATMASGTLQECVGVRDEGDPLVAYHASTNTLAFRTHCGVIQAVTMDLSGLKSSVTMPLRGLVVADMCFLIGGETAVLAVLWHDNDDSSHISTYVVSVRENSLVPGPIKTCNVDCGAQCLLPIQRTGGVVVVGESSVTYMDVNSVKSVPMLGSFGATAWTPVDSNRFLLGDYEGTISILTLLTNETTVTEMSIDPLGQTSQVACMGYVGENLVFIGSTMGNSKLLHISNEIDTDTHSCLTVRQSYANTGPILDLVLVDHDGLGHNHVVTCSGHGKDGSLRIIRSGIGVHVMAEADMGAIAGIWSLRSPHHAEQHDMICVATASQSFFLVPSGEGELEAVGGISLDTNVQTILCYACEKQKLVQVTERAVRLVERGENPSAPAMDSFVSLGEWVAPDSRRINVAAHSGNFLFLGLGGALLILLDVSESEPVLLCQREMSHEIACVAIGSFSGLIKSPVCAVGLWTSAELLLLSCPSLDTMVEETLGTDVLPRSLLLVEMEERVCLLCGLGDGCLLHYQLTNDGLLREKRKVLLGSAEIQLVPFLAASGANCVFAACDRPTIIYSTRQTLKYSTVNIRDISHVCTFNTTAFPDCLVMVTESSLLIGQLDAIQKLHIKEHHIGVTPIRICHMPETATLAVLTCHTTVTEDNEEVDQCSLCILDHKTFEGLDEYALPATDRGLALCVCTFQNCPRPLYVIGSSLVVHDLDFPPLAEAPSQGRVTLLDVVDGKLQRVTEITVDKGVYSLASLPNALCVGMEGQVAVYCFNKNPPSTPTLTKICEHDVASLPLSLEASGDFLLVGDQLRSVAVLKLVWHPDQTSLALVAHDSQERMVSALCFLSANHYVAADKNYNLCTLTQVEDGLLDEDQGLLGMSAWVHTGEFINVFRQGSFAPKLGGDQVLAKPDTQPIVFGTVSGALGMILPLSPDQYTILKAVERRLARRVRSTGLTNHDAFMTYRGRDRTAQAECFVDGNIVEMCLTWPRRQLADLLRDIPQPNSSDVGQSGESINVDAVLQLVESLSAAY